MRSSARLICILISITQASIIFNINQVTNIIFVILSIIHAAATNVSRNYVSTSETLQLIIIHGHWRRKWGEQAGKLEDICVCGWSVDFVFVFVCALYNQTRLASSHPAVSFLYTMYIKQWHTHAWISSYNNIIGLNSTLLLLLLCHFI